MARTAFPGCQVTLHAQIIPPCRQRDPSSAGQRDWEASASHAAAGDGGQVHRLRHPLLHPEAQAQLQVDQTLDISAE